MLASAAALGACDIKNTQRVEKSVGPAIRVIGANVSGTSAIIPSNGVIQIAFDRYLLPATITRQSYQLLDGNRVPIANTQSTYDPVARIVTIFGPDGMGKPWLTSNQPYHLVLPVPADEKSLIGGYRAIDYATLTAPIEYGFFAGPPATVPFVEPTVDFCIDVQPIFLNKCSGCHSAGSSLPDGLLLDTGAGVAATAIGRVSEGSNTSAQSGIVASAPPLFGIDMALVDRAAGGASGDPGSSWLLYKIELAPHPKVYPGFEPTVACTNVSTDSRAPVAYTPVVPYQPEADDIERAILNDYVIGNEMPYPETLQPLSCSNGTQYPLTALTFAERERVRLWIAQGAPVADCGTCTFPTPTSFRLPNNDLCVLSDAGNFIDEGPDATAPDAGDAGP